MNRPPSLRTLAALTLSALLAAPSYAQAIDQENPNVGATNAFHWTYFWQGQTFTPTANTVVGAGVFLQGWDDNVSTTATLDMQLWSDRPDLGGVFLAGGTTPFTVTGSGSGGGWFDVFWSAVTVTPGCRAGRITKRESRGEGTRLQRECFGVQHGHRYAPGDRVGSGTYTVSNNSTIEGIRFYSNGTDITDQVTATFASGRLRRRNTDGRQPRACRDSAHGDRVAGDCQRATQAPEPTAITGDDGFMVQSP